MFLKIFNLIGARLKINYIANLHITELNEEKRTIPIPILVWVVSKKVITCDT